MSNHRLEVLACAIGKLNGAFDNPKSDAFKLKNPSLAKAYTYKHLAETDSQGRRIFTSFIGGFRFLCQDLSWKVAGESRAKGEAGKLKPTSTIADLLKAYKLTKAEHIFELVNFLQDAFDDATISAETSLSYFQLESGDALESD